MTATNWIAPRKYDPGPNKSHSWKLVEVIEDNGFWLAKGKCACNKIFKAKSIQDEYVAARNAKRKWKVHAFPES